MTGWVWRAAVLCLLAILACRCRSAPLVLAALHAWVVARFRATLREYADLGGCDSEGLPCVMSLLAIRFCGLRTDALPVPRESKCFSLCHAHIFALLVFLASSIIGCGLSTAFSIVRTCSCGASGIDGARLVAMHIYLSGLLGWWAYVVRCGWRGFALLSGRSPRREAALGGDSPWDWVWPACVHPCVRVSVRTKLHPRPNHLHEHLPVNTPCSILEFGGHLLRLGKGQHVHWLVAVEPATSNLAARQCKHYRMICITNPWASDCLLACCARQMVTTFSMHRVWSAGQPS